MPLKTFTPVSREVRPFMTVLFYPTKYEMMYAMARFQEYYENAELKGTHFTRAKLQDISPDYYVSWSGCNVPGRVVTELCSWDDLDRHEHAVIRNAIDEKNMVVAVAVESPADVLAGILAHEHAHAIYAADALYRDEVKDMLDSAYSADQLAAMKAILLELGYADDVHLDEIQAYHRHGWDKVFGAMPMDDAFSKAQDNLIACILRDARTKKA